VSSRGRASDRQLPLPLGHAVHGDEPGAGTRREDAPVEGQDLLARVLDPENLRCALRQVRRNKGAPGIDGMSVEQLGPHLKTHWPTIRASLVEGTYTPQPVRRVAIPKPGGGTRHRGVPVVLDRFIEQALLQVLQADWDPTFSEGSYGFRPQRSAHQAWRRHRPTSGRATRGWLILTWRSSSTGSTMTSCSVGCGSGCRTGAW